MDDKILVLHTPSLDPIPTLARLTSSQERDGEVLWAIDNKYYTANVSFQPYAIEGDSADAPLPDCQVVMYLFTDSAPNPLPALLTRISVGDAPDISIAVRVSGRGRRSDEERLDEIGFDLVDLTAAADDDDERPMDPLETIRQTLMTHMWPSMQRKGERRPALQDSDDEPESQEQEAGRPEFPVVFRQGTMLAETRPAGPTSDFPVVPEGYSAVPAELDATEEGAESDEDFGAFADEEEYARLDEWLDTDGPEEDMPVVRSATEVGAAEVNGTTTASDAGIGRAEPSDSSAGASHTASQASATSTIPNGHVSPQRPAGRPANLSNSQEQDLTFDDDFDGDAPNGMPLDPTPLLLHLQEVRAELASVANEDERRVRAAEEVARLMQSLGMGGGFALDELLEDD